MKRVLVRASAMVAVSTLGTTLVLVGIALLFLPGPGLLLVVAGVAVLAREFRWARRLRDHLMRRVDDLRARASGVTGRIDGRSEADATGDARAGARTPARDDVTAA